MHGLLMFLLWSAISRAQAPAGGSVFEVTPLNSTIKFEVKASVDVKGKFDAGGPQTRLSQQAGS
jgi:hypothetical protein